MKVLFMGRKPAASLALCHLVDAGADVVGVVAPMHPVQSSTSTFWRPLLRETARELGIPTIDDSEIYAALSGEGPRRVGSVDLSGLDAVISFLFWKKIKPPLITLPRVGCFNFHPAPLPEFRGRRGYNFAILENSPEYGASLHWIDESIDTGDLVEVRKFPINREETAFSLEIKTMRTMVEMFHDFVSRLMAGEAIPRVPQGPGKSATKKELLEAMEIRPEDPPEIIARKVRAFWYPPHEGAYVTLGGRRYTLVDAGTLSNLGRFLHGSRSTPY